jgi:CBS-domain-containing membrane protein
MIRPIVSEIGSAIAVDALPRIPTTRWNATLVGELAKPVEAANTIDCDRPLLEVVKLLEESKLPTLTVIRNNGVLVGLLEKTSIVDLLQRRAQSSPA